MINRRHALKTLAGATVVGSLSGCVQLATQETTHFHGTPALLESLGSNTGGNAYLTVVGVEGRKTIERFGITREVVTHSWGMLYVVPDYSVPVTYSVIATFTTPSIDIAGRELNPIKDLTVGDIGREFADVIFPFSQDGQVGDREASSITSNVVDDATGKKVLRAFKRAIGGDRSPGNYEPPDLDASAPQWDGEVHEFNISIPDEEAEPISGVLRFDKHDGDFAIVFKMGDADFDATTADWRSTVYAEDPSVIAHPPDDEFNQEVLRRHLLETNLRGARELVKQARTLVDETQELLAKASNKSRNEENETFQVVSNTQDDLTQLDRLLGGVGEDLSSLSTDTIIGGGGKDTLQRITERSKKAADIAARAHERVASHNDTRDEEDDRFVAIERNLGGLKNIVKAYDKSSPLIYE